MNEGWGFQSNPKVQGGLSEARVGFSNPTQPQGGFLNEEGLVVQSNPRFWGLESLVPSPNKPPYFGLSK